MSKPVRILILDHDEQRRAATAAILDFLGEQQCASATLPAQFQFLPEVVLLAADGPSAALGVTLDALAALQPQPAVLLIAAGGVVLPENQPRTPICGTLGWPFTHGEYLEVLHHARVQHQAGAVGNAAGAQLFRELVGLNDGLRAVRHMMGRVAATDATVLVLGESGTGKEVVARS
ncbi:MAG TPA: sigma 54-interacting transcriptional regulator, partial [Pseudomonadales bacterium]|nr:sigma 54-interacting transcriptional regulator [Pseudomonadales bacterium]